MEVHILIPPNSREGIEIRIVGMDEGQNVKVTDQNYYTASSEREFAEIEKAEKPVRVPRWENEDNTVCQYCGKKLLNAKTGRKKRFCCEECRRKWWKDNRDKQKQGEDAIYTIKCACCGKEFKSYANPKRKYCSHECYISAKYYDGKPPELCRKKPATGRKPPVAKPEEPDYSGTPTITLL